MSSSIVPASSRPQLLAAIEDAIRASSLIPGDPHFLRVGGLNTINQHLDTLLEIARSTPDPRDYPAVLRQRICAHCLQGPRPDCPLRRIDACILYRCATPILQTLAHAPLSLLAADANPSLSPPGRGLG